MGALHTCRDSINAIEVDRLRVKPVIKITGEFWAQTTEGDGNFNMFAFLEKEGAQVLVEPIATWIAYMIVRGQRGWQGSRCGGSALQGPEVVRGEEALCQRLQSVQEGGRSQRRNCNVAVLLPPHYSQHGGTPPTG